MLRCGPERGIPRGGGHALAFAAYQEALGLATLYLDGGNRELAEVYLTRAQEVCARAELEPDALMVLPFLC